MSEDELTYRDVEEYERFFNLIPPFLLERFAKKNKNLVSKFKSKIESHLVNLDENHKKKLDLILNSDAEELQGLMNEAYSHTNKKQYKILADPKYKQFIEENLNELRKMV